MTKTPEITNVARRSVLLGLAAGTFVLSVRLASPAMAQEKKYGGDGMPGGLKDDPKLFLSIADDGTVNLLCIRAEMGQGIRTSWGPDGTDISLRTRLRAEITFKQVMARIRATTSKEKNAP